MGSAVLLSILIRGVEPDFYQKTEMTDKVFDTRGFCASQLILCPKCGVIKNPAKSDSMTVVKQNRGGRACNVSVRSSLSVNPSQPTCFPDDEGSSNLESWSIACRQCITARGE